MQLSFVLKSYINSSTSFSRPFGTQGGLNLLQSFAKNLLLTCFAKLRRIYNEPEFTLRRSLLLLRHAVRWAGE